MRIRHYCPDCKPEIEFRGRARAADHATTAHALRRGHQTYVTFGLRLFRETELRAVRDQLLDYLPDCCDEDLRRELTQETDKALKMLERRVHDRWKRWYARTDGDWLSFHDGIQRTLFPLPEGERGPRRKVPRAAVVRCVLLLAECAERIRQQIDFEVSAAREAFKLNTVQDFPVLAKIARQVLAWKSQGVTLDELRRGYGFRIQPTGRRVAASKKEIEFVTEVFKRGAVPKPRISRLRERLAGDLARDLLRRGRVPEDRIERIVRDLSSRLLDGRHTPLMIGCYIAAQGLTPYDQATLREYVKRSKPAAQQSK